MALPNTQNESAWSKYLGQATLLLSWLSGLFLISIVVMVALGVVMRYAFSQPLLGLNEFVQLTALALVMTALPNCTFKNAHVSVDVFEKMLGKAGRWFGDAVTRVLSGFVLAVLAHRAFLKSLDALEWSDATNMLGLLIWPFYMILSVGMALCVLIFALQFVTLFLPRGEEESLP